MSAHFGHIKHTCRDFTVYAARITQLRAIIAPIPEGTPRNPSLLKSPDRLFRVHLKNDEDLGVARCCLVLHPSV